MREIFRKYARFLVISCTIIVVQTNSIETSFDWKPWSDILVYRKLEWDSNDYSWNNRNWTANWITYESNWQIQVAKFSNWSYVQRQDSAFDIYWTQPFTLSWRFKPTSFTSYFNSFWICESWSESTQDKAIEFKSWWISSLYVYNSWVFRASTPNWTIALNTRYNITWTFDWSQIKIYVNWNLMWTTNVSWTYNFSTPVLKLSRYVYRDCDSFLWYVSRFFLSNKTRNQTEITNYVNKVKKKYWIS